MELLGITRLAARAPYTLWGEEKKKTAIASVLTMESIGLDAGWLVLDQATSQTGW